MQSLTQGLQFGVAVAVILFGVRTILGELVPAFQGIAAKVVPGAIPALDAPIVFPYAQNAVLVGFIASFCGGLIGLGALSLWLNPAFGVALILPGLVPHFFTGGAAGVYGNATGGRRGAVFGALANGLLISLLPAFLVGVLGTFGSANTTFGDADFGWLGLLLEWASQAGGAVGLALIGAVGVWGADPGVAFPEEAGGGKLGACEVAGWDEWCGGSDEVAESEGRSEVRTYPKILPPEGAPVPPGKAS